MVLGRPKIASAPSVCTGSYLFFYSDSKAEAESIMSYYMTKFFRFLVSLRKITQDAFRPMYSWVPQQSWDRTWSDGGLYKMYGLTKAETAFIEKTIRPMDFNSAGDDD
jgi:site-specific DNA-methyltransferase (adenine-specific)